MLNDPRALVEFHRRVAAGGAALSTVAYLAVSPEGRTDRHCLLLSQDTVPGLRRPAKGKTYSTCQLVTQSRMASLIASFSVFDPELTPRTSAPNSRMR